jgi:histidinol-phosphate aminotransferase
LCSVHAAIRSSEQHQLPPGGGTPAALQRPLEGRRGLLRLDFNENTVGPSPRVVEAVRSIPADHYAIYPEYDGLREAVVAALSGKAGLRPDHIGLFNGVDAAIHAIFHAYGAPGDRLLTTSPSFGYYTPCARMQGMAIEAIPYRSPDFAFPFEEIQAALTPGTRTPRPPRQAPPAAVALQPQQPHRHPPGPGTGAGAGGHGAPHPGGGG